MGVDTVGLLNRRVTVSDVMVAIEEINHSYVEIYDNDMDFYKLAFNYQGESRHLGVFENYYCEEFLDGKVVTMIKLSKYGVANEIIERIVSRFGGLYIEDDYYGESVYLEATSY